MAQSVVVLTYDHPHRKTQDLLVRLRVIGAADSVVVLGAPWRERRSFVPDIPHRAFAAVDVPMATFCERLGFPYQVVRDEQLEVRLIEVSPATVLIGGAGILPASLVEKHRVVNSHPGYLPNVRGLDALKWAIHEDQPIGVTTYIVSVPADTGWLLQREVVPLYAWDTFHSVALRQFEREVAMLADAVSATDDAVRLVVLTQQYPLHRRMPHRLEALLYDELQLRIARARYTHAEPASG